MVFLRGFFLSNIQDTFFEILKSFMQDVVENSDYLF